MYKLYMCSLLMLLILGSNSFVSFTSPVAGDIWAVGQTQTVSWTEVGLDDNPEGDYLSVRLYQVFPNGSITLDFEYIDANSTEDSITVNPEGWIVTLDTASGINSSVSNIYILALYLETTTSILAQSGDFIINNTTAPSSSTTAKVFFATTSSASTTSTSGPPISAMTSTSTTATPNATSGGLSSGAKAGIGIGVLAAAILGLFLGWFLLGRPKQQNGEVPGTIWPTFSSKPMPAMNDYGAVSQAPHISSGSGVVPVTYNELAGSHQG